MGSVVSLTFRYSEKDYVQAMRTHYASVLRLKLDIPFIGLLALLGVYWLLQPSEPPWLWITPLGASAALALLLVAAFWVIPGFVFRHEPKLQDEYSLTFSPEGIHYRTAHIDSQIQWSLYSRALIDAHSYILYYGKPAFTVIPRRVFEDSAQQEAFDRLLTEKIPKIVRKDA